MRIISISIVLLFIQSAAVLGQAAAVRPEAIGRKVSFVAMVDAATSTKDGIYLNGYVLNLSPTQITALNGKKVRISGRVSIVKASVDKTSQVHIQGREKGAMHILKPKIRIINP